MLCYITKISKIESNSQRGKRLQINQSGCVISQRYLKLKAIHNRNWQLVPFFSVVLYHKDI